MKKVQVKVLLPAQVPLTVLLPELVHPKEQQVCRWSLKVQQDRNCSDRWEEDYPIQQVTYS